MKPYEFWHPRIFEVPYYVQLLSRCLLLGMSPANIAKANYALDHGEIGLGSKFSTQMAFEQSRFPATGCFNLPVDCQTAQQFSQQIGLPVILKPLIGTVGKGVIKIAAVDELTTALAALHGDYIIQSYCPDPQEYGVFFIRKAGINRITGINQKHFPTVVGDGHQNLNALATAHPRFTPHWGLFLKYLDLAKIPAAGEQVRLSFIGSHTMGCRFTDDTAITTSALERALFKVCESQPGFNFGRFDLKTQSREAFLDGAFTIIEVNGIASLPTHMFDPANSLRRAYQIFFEHGRYLVDIAYEHRHRAMQLDSYRTLLRRAANNHAALNKMHETAKSAGVKTASSNTRVSGTGY